MTSAARIQRWCLFLGAFSYDIRYRGTKEHANCDGLSRLPLPVTPKNRVDSVSCFYTTVINTLPVTERDLRRETRRDPDLARVVRFVEEGWDSYEACDQLAPYASRSAEIVVHNGVLMWGGRVIVPPKLRSRVLDTLHEGHVNMAKMKGLGRGYTWWPLMDKDIERTVKECDGCQRVANNPSQVPLHRWEYPASPSQRLHIDFAGPFQGRMLLVVVDASIKWPEIFLMKNTTAEETVKTLRTLLARMGLPEQIVSDNGPQFTSDVFKRFAQSNGIRHIMGAPGRAPGSMFQACCEGRPIRPRPTAQA